MSVVDTGIFKGYKIRLNPTLDQERLFSKFSAAARIVYNKCLEFNQEFYADYNKSPSLEDYEDFLLKLKGTKGFEWLEEVSCEVLRQSYRDLDTAFSRFFKGVSAFPKFKSKSDKESFYQRKDSLKVTHTTCNITDIGKVDFADYFLEARFGVEYSNPRVTYEGNHWYLSFSEEVKETPTPRSLKGIGIDVGVTNLATVSNGVLYESVAKHCTKILWYEKKIARLDRSISKTKTHNLHSVSKKFSKEHKKAFVRKLSEHYKFDSFRLSKVKAKKVTPKLFTCPSQIFNHVLRVDERVLRFIRSSQNSRRIRKFYARRRKFYHKIKCIRENYLHQVSNDIVKPKYEVSDEEKDFRKLKNKTQKVTRKIAGQKKRLENLNHSENQHNSKKKKITNYLKKLQGKLEESVEELRKYNYDTKSKSTNPNKVSKVITPAPNFICMETLDVKEMCKNKKMAKAILRESFYKLKSFIKYKCKRLGISFVEVPKTFPSSKLCSNCGTKVDRFKKYHTFQCPVCKTKLDRDFNAALNLEKEGFRILKQSKGFTVNPKDLSNLPFSCSLGEGYCSICNVAEKCSRLWRYQIPFYCKNYSNCDFSNCTCCIGNQDYSTLCKKKQERLVADLPFSCVNHNSCDFNSCSLGIDYSEFCKTRYQEWLLNLPFSCKNCESCNLDSCSLSRNYSEFCKTKLQEWLANLPFSCSYFSRNGLSTECSEFCSYSSTCNKNLDSMKERLPFSCSISNHNSCIWKKWCSYCYPYYTPQSN